MTRIVHYACCLLGGLLLARTSAAQNAVGYGDWQLHLATYHPLKLADAGDRVYVTTENACYFLDKKLNTTQVLSQRDGLNDVRVGGVAFDSVTKQTVLAYNTYNIDVIKANGQVRNLNDVLRKGLLGKKEVSHVGINNSRRFGNQAYISTLAGLVVVNLDRLEISETYTNIGPNGTAVAVTTVAVSGDTVFAATPGGLLRGLLRDNLLDYRNWRPETPAGSLPVTALATHDGHVYAAVNQSGGIYRFQPRTGTWAAVPLPATNIGEFKALRSSPLGLLFSVPGKGLYRLNTRTQVGSQLVAPMGGSFATDVVGGRGGTYYVADYQAGLQRRSLASAEITTFSPNGPGISKAFALLTDARSGKVNLFSGGYTDRYLPDGGNSGFMEYSGGQWTSVTSQMLSATQYPNPQGVSRGARTPDGTLYIANFGGGLLEWKGPGQFRQFEAGTAGAPFVGFAGLPSNGTRLCDVAADAEGHVWIAERHIVGQVSGLYRLTPTDPPVWETVPYAPGLETPDRLALDNNGYVWASVARKNDGNQVTGGINAVDPTGTNPTRYFAGTGNGLPSNEIYDVAKDRRGDIWIATLNGVAVFNDPSSYYFEGTAFRAPIVRRGDGSGFAALIDNAVKAIAVDGGNRKWFGTDNGLWLFSEDGDEAIMHFTTANSPLPSNHIVDLDINDKTGELWVATDLGVVAYRGTSTVTEGTPKCSQAFPNPVRPDFAGTVGVSGLANNSLVKITDVAGHLVYATQASGGTVAWNMTNPNGERVRPGVYLVLASDADGKNTCVSKIAVLSK